MRFGIWYSEVEFVGEGWLSFEGGNGRPRRLEFETWAEAEDKARYEREKSDRCAYLVLPFDITRGEFDVQRALAREPIRAALRKRYA